MPDEETHLFEEEKEEKSKERGFTIVDRRGEESEAPDSPDPTPSDASSGPTDLPGVDFAGFCLSLATSALYHLGLVADPETGQPGQPNFPVARQTIDTLILLQEKTQGNLTDEEQELLTNLLTELRMRFVEISK